MRSAESMYMEAGQAESETLADEYVRNFLHNEAVVGEEMEARLYKELLPKVGRRSSSLFIKCD